MYPCSPTCALARWIALPLALMAAWPVSAQAPWPNKPITYVVPFAPGGNTDTLARLLNKELQAGLGQPVVIENKPGAGGVGGGDKKRTIGRREILISFR